jgi:hypothetical protein
MRENDRDTKEIRKKLLIEGKVGQYAGHLLIKAK